MKELQLPAVDWHGPGTDTLVGLKWGRLAILPALQRLLRLCACLTSNPPAPQMRCNSCQVSARPPGSPACPLSCLPCCLRACSCCSTCSLLPSCCELTRLTSLTLEGLGGPITEPALPPAATALSQLRRLSLRAALVGASPAVCSEVLACVGTFAQLTYLNLEANSLLSLPSTLSTLQQLRVRWLAGIS